MFNRSLKCLTTMVATVAIVGTLIPGIEASAADFVTKYEDTTNGVTYMLYSDKTAVAASVNSSATEIKIVSSITYTTPAQGDTESHTDNYTVSLGSYFQIAKNTNVKKLTIDNSNINITSIPNGFAMNCSSLEEVVLNDSVTSIGDMAFYGCEKLNNINNSKVTTIGESAFSGCENLTNIDISKVTTIGKNAFKDCNLSDGFEVPSTVTSIGADSFSGNKCIKVSSYATSMTGMHKVQFISSGNIIEKYYIKDGSNIPITVPGISGVSSWTPSTDSTKNVEDLSSEIINSDVTYTANYTYSGSTSALNIAFGNVTNETDPLGSTTIDTARNRSNISCNFSNFASNLDYYYTLDGTEPSPSNSSATKIDKSTASDGTVTVTIPGPDSDFSNYVDVKVSGFYNGISVSGTSSSKKIRFKAKTYTVRFLDITQSLLLESKEVEMNNSIQDYAMDLGRRYYTDFNHWATNGSVPLYSITADATFYAVLNGSSSSGGAGSIPPKVDTSITKPTLTPMGTVSSPYIIDSTKLDGTEPSQVDLRYIRTGESTFVLAYCTHDGNTNDDSYIGVEDRKTYTKSGDYYVGV